MTVGMAAGTANSALDTAYSTVYVKLHTGDPGSAGASAAAAGDTTRKQATMASASGGSKAMTSMASGWTNGGTSETLTHVSLWTASSAGTFLRSIALSSSQAWASGNTYALTTLSDSISPIAA